MQKETIWIIVGILVVSTLLLFAADLLGITGRAAGQDGGPQTPFTPKGEDPEKEAEKWQEQQRNPENRNPEGTPKIPYPEGGNMWDKMYYAFFVPKEQRAPANKAEKIPDPAGK